MSTALKTPQDQSESTSISSQDSHPAPAPHQQILSSILEQIAINRAKYQRVLSDKPEFNFSLYRPTADLSRQTNLQLMTVQLDRLMEDEHHLDKQLSKISFFHQDNEMIKDQQTSHKMTHYEFLRSMWKQPEEECSAEEKVDLINHRVGSIKGYLKQMGRREQEESQLIGELVRNSEEYQRLNKQYFDLSLKCERQAMKTKQVVDGLQLRLKELKTKNQEYERREKQQNQDRKKFEHQTLKLKQRVQTLEFEIIQKDRELRTLNTLYKQKPNQDANHPEISIINQSFTLLIRSPLITEPSSFSTSRSMKETIDFLQMQVPLQKLIETGNKIFFQSPSFADKLFNIASQSENVPMRRRPTVEKQRKVFLGSEQKKRRFQRRAVNQ